MAQVNMIGEMLARHSEEEVIAHLAKLMGGVMRNFSLAQKEKDPAALWASFGDVALVASTLKAMDKINQEKKQQSKNSL